MSETVAELLSEATARAQTQRFGPQSVALRIFSAQRDALREAAEARGVTPAALVWAGVREEGLVPWDSRAAFRFLLDGDYDVEDAVLLCRQLDPLPDTVGWSGAPQWKHFLWMLIEPVEGPLAPLAALQRVMSPPLSDALAAALALKGERQADALSDEQLRWAVRLAGASAQRRLGDAPRVMVALVQVAGELDETQRSPHQNRNARRYVSALDALEDAWAHASDADMAAALLTASVEEQERALELVEERGERLLAPLLAHAEPILERGWLYQGMLLVQCVARLVETLPPEVDPVLAALLGTRTYHFNSRTTDPERFNTFLARVPPERLEPLLIGAHPYHWAARSLLATPAVIRSAVAHARAGYIILYPPDSPHRGTLNDSYKYRLFSVAFARYGEAALPELLAGLREPGGPGRGALVWRLSLLRAPSAAPQLVAECCHPDDPVRKAAQGGLRLLPQEIVLPLIASALSARRGATRDGGARALLALTPSPEVLALAERAAKSAKSVEQRLLLELVRHRTEISPEATLDALRADPSEAAAELLVAAEAALADAAQTHLHSDTDALRRWYALCKDRPFHPAMVTVGLQMSWLREALFSNVFPFGGEAAPALARALLQDDWPNLSGGMGVLIREAPDAGALVFVKGLLHRLKSVRNRAAEGLGALSPQALASVRPWLVRLKDAKRADVRATAARLVGTTG